MSDETDKTPPKPKQIRNRKFRDRPQNTSELITAINAGRLDKRTIHAQRIVGIRRAIGERPLEVAKGMLADVLAVNATIFHSLAEEMSRPGFRLLDADGNLNPLIAHHWESVQRAVSMAATALARMETKADAGNAATAANRGANGEIDISALVLSADAGGESGE